MNLAKKLYNKSAKAYVFSICNGLTINVLEYAMTILYSKPTSPKFQDITNLSFGRIKVIKYAYTKINDSGNPNYFWRCLCSCGEEFITTGNRIRIGKTKSCGCYRRDVSAINNTTHGLRKHILYPTWARMTQRCNNPTSADYYLYGARGIKVCDRWMSFPNFLADMGNKPSKKHSIDRINNDGNYEPSNCRWATPKEQSNNRRKKKRRNI